MHQRKIFREWLRSDERISARSLGCIVNYFIRDLITGTSVGLSLSAKPLKPLFSKHFCQPWGSPPLPCWLTEWLERRLQTIL
jgi:hypothetical protein